MFPLPLRCDVKFRVSEGATPCVRAYVGSVDTACLASSIIVACTGSAMVTVAALDASGQNVRNEAVGAGCVDRDRQDR